jgi:surface carbohydrate biosynthesis protein
MTRERPLYFLIEETGRELRARLLLALHAARAGYSSVIAPQWLTWEILGDIPKGLLLFKGNSAVQARNMANAKAAGHLVASIEEEALGLCDAAQINRCYDPSVARCCDLLLFQGPFQRDCVTAFLGPPKRSSVTGNPRIDLLAPRFGARHSSERDDLKRRFGDFLLVNTNFSTINPRDLDACAVLDTCLNAGWYDPKVPEDIEIFFSEAERERTDLRNLIDLVHALIDRGFAHPIVIRPHPAENLSIWEQAFAGCESVHIHPDGDLVASISAAKLLLHTSCTTGMEAFVLGKPAISLRTPESEWSNIITSNLVNPAYTSVEDAIAAIEAIFAGAPVDQCPPTFNQPSHDAELARHVSVDPDHDASARIVAACVDLLAEQGTGGNGPATLGAFGHAATSDRSIELSTLNADAARNVVQELATTMGFEAIPQIEEIAPGVILCHPLATSPAISGHGSP